MPEQIERLLPYDQKSHRHKRLLKNIQLGMLGLLLIFLTANCGGPVNLLGVSLDLSASSSVLKTQRPDILVNPNLSSFKVPSEIKKENSRDYICMTHYDSIELRSWVKKVRSNINQCSAALDYYENAIDTLNGVKEDEEKKKKKKKKGD